uniref:Uncharacterized protein n=1 Tax=Arundo donax TaxID=35708 RepID=A0A0A9STK5_ARUDO
MTRLKVIVTVGVIQLNDLTASQAAKSLSRSNHGADS